MVRIAQFVCYISKNSELGWAKTIGCILFNFLSLILDEVSVSGMN